MERDRSATPDLLRIVRRRWLTIVVAVLIAAGAALGLSLLQDKTYAATSALVFGDQPSISGLFSQGSSGSNSDPARVAATTVELVAARDVVDRTAQVMHLSPNFVGDAIDVKGKGVSNVVSVTASAHSPRLAASLANTYAAQYIELRREADRTDLKAAQDALTRKLDGLPASQRRSSIGRLLQQRLDELAVQGPLDTGSVRIAERAFEPNTASSPNIKLNTVLGAVIGLLLGLGIATLRERVDSRLVEADEQSDAWGLPILAALPGGRALEKSSAEAFRGLQARIEHFHFGRDIRCVLVTSNSRGEGTSTVAWHLASAAALVRNRRVLLIEADMRKAELASVRGLAAQPGLSQIVAGERTLAESVQQPPSPNGDSSARETLPDVLTAGVPSPRGAGEDAPYELLGADAMADILREADEQYDYVVIDTPPLGEVADAIPLVRHVDGVLVVSRRGKVTRGAAESLRDLLRALGAPVLGVVLIGTKRGTEIPVSDARSGRRRSGQPMRSGS
jgi:capsular exopolysaccharide synthesis family protein